jgi:hypothetical protein
VDARNEGGETALHLAAARGRVHAVRWLLVEGGADARALNISGAAPLHYCCYPKGFFDDDDDDGDDGDGDGGDVGGEVGEEVEEVEEVEEDEDGDAFLDAEDGGGGGGAAEAATATPIPGTAEASLACARLLLSAGADPNAQTEGALASGVTALHLASEAGLAATVRALIDAGAEVGVRDSQGHSAWDKAVRGGHEQAARELAEALEGVADAGGGAGEGAAGGGGGGGGGKGKGKGKGKGPASAAELAAEMEEVLRLQATIQRGSVFAPPLRGTQ